MSGTAEGYLLDTNIFIYFFNGEPGVEPLFDEIFRGERSASYCPLTWVLLLCYPGLSDAEANSIRELLRSLACTDLTPEILDRAASIRQAHRTPLPDALIGACALENDLVLVTRNVDDFKSIQGLSILNPFSD